MTLQSDYRTRGYSVTRNEPAATVQVSYDGMSGIYANGSLIGSLDEDDRPAVTGAIVNVGYAHKLASGVSLDGGYVHTGYFRSAYAPNRGDVHYDEIYLGAVFHRIAYHVYYSPDYLNTGVATLYNEVAGSTALADKLQLNGRIGVTSYLGAPAQWRLKTDYDWEVGLARSIGPVTLLVRLDGGKSNLVRFSQGKSTGGTRLVGGVNLAF